MSLDPNLKPYELLAIAIRSEIDAGDLYRNLSGRIKNEVLKQKLNFLSREEDRHKGILERMFGDRFPDRKPEVPLRPNIPLKSVPVEEEMSVVDLFRLAMKKERQAEEFYKDSKIRMEDAESRRILDYLRRAERSHYFMLKSEVDLIERFPDYYNVEDFHVAQDLFHIGP
jgi:rubrerythrin